MKQKLERIELTGISQNESINWISSASFLREKRMKGFYFYIEERKIVIFQWFVSDCMIFILKWVKVIYVCVLKNQVTYFNNLYHELDNRNFRVKYIFIRAATSFLLIHTYFILRMPIVVYLLYILHWQCLTIHIFLIFVCKNLGFIFSTSGISH